MNSIGKCIICHRDGQEMSDEHVIPEAIGGYYHIYSVCKDCNSKLGYQVDKHLLNNWFTDAKRNEHNLPGKSGKVPHPLIAEGTLEDGRRVRMEKDEEGHLYPYLIPDAPVVSDDGRTIQFSVDSRDTKNIDKMVNAILKRKGWSGKKITMESSLQHVTIENPAVRIPFSIDVKSYILSLLKIAYEFTVDRCSSYFDDPMANLYSEILLSGDASRVDEINVLANYLLDKKFQILPQIIDNSAHRHILMLTEIKGQLVCQIKLFDVYGISILMSNQSYGFEGQKSIVAINDFEKHTCDIFSLEEIIPKLVIESQRQYTLDEVGRNMVDSAMKESGNGIVGFACNERNENVIFNCIGVPLDTEDSYMMRQDAIRNANADISEDGFVCTYTYPKGFYYLLRPMNILIRILGVKETLHISKM